MNAAVGEIVVGFEAETLDTDHTINHLFVTVKPPFKTSLIYIKFVKPKKNVKKYMRREIILCQKRFSKMNIKCFVCRCTKLTLCRTKEQEHIYTKEKSVGRNSFLLNYRSKSVASFYKCIIESSKSTLAHNIQ
jgi:hypothetical protein